LDQLAENIALDQTKKKELNSTNIQLQAMDITKSNYRGLSFDVSSDNIGSRKASVTLPNSILNKVTQNTVRVGFIYFANNKLFQEEGKLKVREETTSQVVLSSSLYGVDTANLPDSVLLKFPRPVKTGVTNQSCVFWNEKGLKLLLFD